MLSKRLARASPSYTVLRPLSLSLSTSCSGNSRILHLSRLLPAPLHSPTTTHTLFQPSPPPLAMPSLSAAVSLLALASAASAYGIVDNALLKAKIIVSQEWRRAGTSRKHGTRARTPERAMRAEH